ncbi:Voltage-dependent R-type calcium channel subunit alpha [Wickerhamomyces ciferrii]|uniref:Voltage-dependent R-type calcium channel subunit alpha n=1 Tax=Wickerhamomyces ciferrii (strain ATCC 14091 / BCRC 22168 / CBS 111 / JCM 3599 / NBRC 0793 / NRRL Y-1031 F-60-10) TaxID=1206466 RepID=K0KNA5_WICCF|nr:Voltage-dependent R-type calcium channel subunit alpha [Wickerhamomyces ciferrii]CCH46735.1 Voltage-dependent R-type calcium channel subunit alpha [Wickerhamomyces ciferrii]
MNHPSEDIKSSISRPSTPPLFNIGSPDFKNFKSWVRSSPFGNDSDQGKDQIQLSDMDFEAAYAMFTAQTPPQVPGTPPSHQIPLTSSNSPITNYTQEIHQQIHDLQQNHQKNNGGNSKISMTSPGIAQFLTNSPNLSPSDLDSFGIFQNYDELLSANESNAIEQFLDSIMDEKSSNKQNQQRAQSSQQKQLQTPQPVQPLQPLTALQPDPMPPSPNEESSQSLQPHVQIFPKTSKLEETQHLNSNENKRCSIDTPSPNTSSTSNTPNTSISITLNNSTNLNIPQDYNNSFPKELGISNITPSIPNTRSSSNSSNSSVISRQYKKRKLLTEDEKKYNHTSSEQRRRSIIKNSFDNLVQLLPNVRNTKKPTKSVVLENTAYEIERLISINNELRKLLDSN